MGSFSFIFRFPDIPSHRCPLPKATPHRIFRQSKVLPFCLSQHIETDAKLCQLLIIPVGFCQQGSPPFLLHLRLCFLIGCDLPALFACSIQLLTEGYNRTPSPARPRRRARMVKIFRFMHFSLPLYQKQKIRLPTRRFAGDSSFDTASASFS